MAASKRTKNIRIIIADEEFVLRQGIRKILECDPRIQILDETAVAQYIPLQAQRLKADTIILGMSWQDSRAALDAITQVKALRGRKWVVVIADGELAVRARLAGADATLTQRFGRPEDMLEAIFSAAFIRKAHVHTADPIEDPLVNLCNCMTEAFSLDEVRELCFKLKIEFEELSGETKSSKLRAMILFCTRRKRVSELIELSRQLRPAMPWPQNWGES